MVPELASARVSVRRSFFRDLARETLVWCEELCGVRHIRLSDIPRYPLHVFAALVPRIRPEVEIIPQTGRVCARLPGANDVLTLFDTSDPASLALFNLFNGQLTLAQAAAQLAASMAWPAEQSMARTRAFFLRLLDLRVCVPCNPPSEMDGCTRPPDS